MGVVLRCLYGLVRVLDLNSELKRAQVLNVGAISELEADRHSGGLLRSHCELQLPRTVEELLAADRVGVRPLVLLYDLDDLQGDVREERGDDALELVRPPEQVYCELADVSEIDLHLGLVSEDVVDGLFHLGPVLGFAKASLVPVAVGVGRGVQVDFVLVLDPAVDVPRGPSVEVLGPNDKEALFLDEILHLVRGGISILRDPPDDELGVVPEGLAVVSVEFLLQVSWEQRWLLPDAEETLGVSPVFLELLLLDFDVAVGNEGDLVVQRARDHGV